MFLNPGGAAGRGGYVVPMKPLHVGPGKPGPGDEWHVPALPVQDAEGEGEGTAGPDRRA